MEQHKADEIAFPVGEHFLPSDISGPPPTASEVETLSPLEYQPFSPHQYGLSNKAFGNDRDEHIFHEYNNSGAPGNLIFSNVLGSGGMTENPVDSSFCSVAEPKHFDGEEGQENEAYDGDEETDQSHVYGDGSVSNFPDFQRRDPFPVLERPGSGRYMKNPSLERKKGPRPIQRMYDPQTGLYITPPTISTTTNQPSPSSKVRKRIPRPPRKLYMNCAYLWSCLTCLLGAFFCAIPAFRYTINASASRKIGDYNSAHSYLKKVLILCIVALVVAATGWTLIILYLTGHLPAG